MRTYDEQAPPTSGIIRVQHDQDKPYFVMSRALAEDESLSFAARGMMAYLLAKPDNWEIRLSDLVAKSPGGIRHVRSILKELETHGYIHRTRRKAAGGRFVWVTTVYESPSIQNVHMDAPSTRFVSTDGVSMENVEIYQVISEPSNQSIKNKSGGGVKRDQTPPPQVPPTVVDALMKAGLDRGQAKVAYFAFLDRHGRPYTDDEMKRVVLWREKHDREKRLARPGAVLWRTMRDGDLPDDMPDVPREIAREEMVWIELDNKAMLQVPKRLYDANPWKYKGRVV